MQRSRKSKGKAQLVRVVNPTPMRPPQIRTSKRINTILRYQSNGTGGVSILRQDLLNFVSMAYNTTQSYRLCNAIKLNRIEMYDQPVVAGTANSPISCTWESQYSPEETIIDTSTSVYAARISSRPPKNSTASFWSVDANNENEVLVALTPTVGTIVDLHITAILQNDFVVGNAAVIVTFSSATLTAGILYYQYLDRRVNGGGAAWKPQGLTTAL